MGTPHVSPEGRQDQFSDIAKNEEGSHVFGGARAYPQRMSLQFSIRPQRVQRSPVDRGPVAAAAAAARGIQRLEELADAHRRPPEAAVEQVAELEYLPLREGAFVLAQQGPELLGPYPAVGVGVDGTEVRGDGGAEGWVHRRLADGWWCR